jgi:hypothetical protein
VWRDQIGADDAIQDKHQRCEYQATDRGKAAAAANGHNQADLPRGRVRAEGEEVTKTLREFEGPTPITKAEREARKVFRQVDAENAMTEYETAQKVFHANRERLKAERLEREAAGTPVPAKKAKTKKKAI